MSVYHNFHLGPYAEWLVRPDEVTDDFLELVEGRLSSNSGLSRPPEVEVGGVTYHRFCYTPGEDRPGASVREFTSDHMVYGIQDLRALDPQAEIDWFVTAFGPELRQLVVHPPEESEEQPHVTLQERPDATLLRPRAAGGLLAVRRGAGGGDRRRRVPMLSKPMQRDVRFVAAMSVRVRRAMGKDEATIRREALAVASRAVAKNCPDVWDQESMYAAFEHAVDESIAQSR